MNQPVSLGASAQVIPLPTAAAQPVQQTRTCGRLPKSVGRLWVARQQRREMDHKKDDAARRLRNLAENIAYMQSLVPAYQNDLAVLARKSKGGSHV